MEFRTFLDQMIPIPRQIVKSARTVTWRLSNWTDLTPTFFRLCDSLPIERPVVEWEAVRCRSREEIAKRVVIRDDPPQFFASSPLSKVGVDCHSFTM